MRYKDIGIPVLLLVCAVRSKLVVQILAIMHIFLIINGITQDGLDMVMRIEKELETRLRQCFPCLINGADLLPNHSSIPRC